MALRARSSRRRRRSTGESASAAHELPPAGLIRRELVVHVTEQSHVLHRRIAPERDRDDVVELEVPDRTAAVAVLADVRAATGIPLVDGALHLRGDRARPRA